MPDATTRTRTIIITRSSGCGQPQAGSALNEVLKLNFNDVDYNMFQLNQRSQIIS